ncbi:DNA polymerase III subunit delta [Proteinivorax hydrogeniformans]|uniref:DNA polymerase III subunit delta n=1 Tax=Proteinivorax hydrogeniformans TaxID=1826727 RepID=A0AAU8HWK5_9FIRM
MDKEIKVKKSNLSNLYLFYGEERYWTEKNIKKIHKAVFADNDEMKEYNYDLIGADFTPMKVLEALQGLPFMSEKRLVVLNNTGVFKKTPTKKEKELSDVIINYLENPNPQTIFIIAEVDCHNIRSNKIFKMIDKEGVALQCSSLKPYEVRSWIEKQFQNHHIKVTGGIIDTLVNNLNNDLYALENEIKKIISYIGDKDNVTINDVNAVCTFVNTDNIFGLIDNIANGKTDEAIKTLHTMNQNGSHYLLIYSMIVNHFRLLTKVLDLLERGYTSKNINSKLKLHPYRLEKAIKQASRFTLKKLLKKLEILARYEGKIKQGKLEGIKGLEMVIVEMKETN